MKKLVMTILTLLTCGAAYALPVGNPSEASLFLDGAWWDSYCCDPCDPCFSWYDAWSFRVGFYGDYVFNRHLAIDNGHNDRGQGVHRTELFTNAGYLAFNICDRVDFFGTLGATNIFMRTNVTSFAPVFVIGDFKFETDFSWSVGARATLWECDCFALGMEGQYFQTNPDVDHFIRGDTGTVVYFDTNNSTSYSEWQVGLGASYRFATNCPSFSLVPYAAIKWSNARWEFASFTFTDADTTFTLHRFEPYKNWGYAIGMSLTLCDMIGVTVEGRFADEKAVHVNGQFRF